MRIDFHKNFDKQFARLPKKQKEQFTLRLALYVEDSYNPLLNNHALQGAYQGYRSINVNADLRAIFFPLNDQHIEFVAIGTHSQLYQ